MSERTYTDDDLLYAIEAAYELGVAHGHAQAAADAEAANLSWSTFKRLSYEERVAQRIAEMEAFDVVGWLEENYRRLCQRDAANRAAA